MKREWGMIATWRMAGDAIKLGAEILNEKGKCQDAVEKAIMQVEDYPFYKSVGYGGLPNEDCEVELDAAFMDGKTLSIGAVAGIRDYKNPVSIISTNRRTFATEIKQIVIETFERLHTIDENIREFVFPELIDRLVVCAEWASQNLQNGGPSSVTYQFGVNLKF